jgi:Cu+-exporting ATPase
MSRIEQKHTFIIRKPVEQDPICYHCGTPCVTNSIPIEEKYFCCEGCKLVYEIINNNGLCDYYKIQSHPGLSQIKGVRKDKYSYLDNPDIVRKLLKFTDGVHSIITLYIPGVHCSSCMWLLEHMHRIHPGITESRLNFTAKEVTIHFLNEQTGVRQIVELLTTLGYEPYISLDDSGEKKPQRADKKKIYKLGVAGFCFGNIMMLSFPEYLTGSAAMEHQYALSFRVLNLLLALPVFFFSASEFFSTAWAGLRQRVLNIDAPIALAILITFARSVYEITSNTGAGYLDSMSGIVFFMLVGRVVQERTYRSMSFHRDYKAYFPIAVNILTAEGTESRHLQDLKERDVVLLHNEEIIPADAIVLKGNARIDYSFVTGESEPVKIGEGEMVYAGGKQAGEQITIQIIKPVAGSYLTSLWNHYSFTRDKGLKNDAKSVIHLLSKFFTVVLLGLAVVTAIFWAFKDPAVIIPSVSAMLIVACPCALLLSATFTNGNLLRLFSNNGLFLRDATIIEQLGKIDHIVFDKTGTLTQGNYAAYLGSERLSDEEKALLYSTVVSSQHPYSKALAAFPGKFSLQQVTSWKEVPGKGIEAVVNGHRISVGSATMVGINKEDPGANLYVKIDERTFAFCVFPHFREAIPSIISGLGRDFGLSLLSGDNNRQESFLKGLFSEKSTLLFRQQPMDKLRFIEDLQQNGHRVMMIGDGLNDAGALQQSNVGITLADDINNFTPACDAILDAKRLQFFPALLKLARSGRTIINISFIVSILYNIVGLSIAMQGKMNPMIAAILMPASTLTIVLITGCTTSLIAKGLGLSVKSR